jgi:RNA polymerase sigma factor for flagellar operon FliA
LIGRFYLLTGMHETLSRGIEESGGHATARPSAESSHADSLRDDGSADLGVQMNRLVYCLAGRLLARIPRGTGVEMSDLIQAGNLGWVQAARSFTAGRGAPLAGYAKFRIRGEMLDTVRRNLGRGSVAGCWRASQQNAEGNEDEGSQMDRIAAPAENSPLSLLARTQRAAILSQEIARLPDRHRTVVQLRYSRGFSLREIGACLRVKESRACQIHQSALGRLRRALSGRGVTVLSQLM